MAKKSRFKVLNTDKIDMIPMTNNIKERIKEQEMNKDKAKMQKRIDKIVEETKPLQEEYDKATEIINNHQQIQRNIIAKVQENQGRINEIKEWMEAIEGKKDKKVENKK